MPGGFVRLFEYDVAHRIGQYAHNTRAFYGMRYLALVFRACPRYLRGQDFPLRIGKTAQGLRVFPINILVCVCAVIALFSHRIKMEYLLHQFPGYCQQ